MLVYLNGRFIDRSEAMVSVDDRCFIFADGAYEAMRSWDGTCLERDRHLARLRRGLTELRLIHPDADPERLFEAGESLIERNGLGEGHALIYFQVGRGVAPRRHAFPAEGTPPTVFVSVGRPANHDDKCAGGVPAVTHEDLRWGRCDLKTISLLPNVLANQYATERGCYEALLVRDGVLTEATHSNVFAVIAGTLRTHPATRQILPGVTRAVVIGLAERAGYEVREAAVTIEELRIADEVFLTGTTTDVMPVITVDDRAVGSGAPGPVARRLSNALWSHRAAQRTGTSKPQSPAYAPAGEAHRT